MVAKPEALEPAALTRLIRAWKQGDLDARDASMKQLYSSLRDQAAYILRSQHQGGTLNPTALVNEVFIRLDKAQFDTPSQHAFRALSGRAMRNVLISHIRAKNAAKRDGIEVTVTLSAIGGEERAMSAESLLDLSNALEALEALDARCYRLCEGHYFAGLTYPELAEMEGVSEATVTRDLRFARAWLKTRLSDDRSDDSE
ncbi:MAG: sigma-70 family RNA polymerase sigma factor [Wenzhouxiangellaceae bacterium]